MAVSAHDGGILKPGFSGLLNLGERNHVVNLAIFRGLGAIPMLEGEVADFAGERRGAPLLLADNGLIALTFQVNNKTSASFDGIDLAVDVHVQIRSLEW